MTAPANPLGIVFPKDELIKLLKALPDTLIVLDEAYIEFANKEDDLTYLVNEYENLIVTRTLSKAFALAGSVVVLLLPTRISSKLV